MSDTGVAHQFDDPQQKHAAATLGIWVFLAGEVLFFGGLFLGYTVYRIKYHEAFSVGSQHLYMWIAAANTAILLLSSLLVALAHHAVGENERRRALRLTLGTIGLGLSFLLLKAVEYYLDYREGMVPVLHFETEKITGAAPSRVELFLVFYYIMTGLHAVHVAIGVAIWCVMAGFIRWGADLARHRNAIEASGLYWHFVDIVWLFLFPLLYLLGV